mmetsp:Transcript_42337/g.113264  ORF Transcript_42337/g.113264 Transcript_42337/m.113264 type:complete len:140 (-) Transcript_42337:29-448(-)
MTGFAGKIDAEDLLVALRALGFEPKKDEVKMLMSDYDKENSGAINKQQFVEIFKAKWMETIQPDVLHLAFQLYDTEGTGNISFENLRNVMDMIGDEVQDEELEEMLGEAAALGQEGSAAAAATEDLFVRIMEKIKVPPD